MRALAGRFVKEYEYHYHPRGGKLDLRLANHSVWRFWPVTQDEVDDLLTRPDQTYLDTIRFRTCSEVTAYYR